MKHAECLAAAETERKKDVAEKRAEARELAGEVKAKRVRFLEAAREEREKAEKRRQCKALVGALSPSHMKSNQRIIPQVEAFEVKIAKIEKGKRARQEVKPLNSFV